MQPLSRSQYRAYKREALKRGDDVYKRNDAASIFKASFYEADAAARKEKMAYTLAVVFAICCATVDVGLVASVLF